jgi:hypothetical protein
MKGKHRMSHFVVLVVGDNIDEQLAPFNEQPENDSEYLEFNDCTEEVLKDWEVKTVNDWYPKSRVTLKTEEFQKYAGARPGEILEMKIEEAFYHATNKGDRAALYEERNANCTPVYFEVESCKTERIDNPNGKGFRTIQHITAKAIEPPIDVPVKREYPSIDDFVEQYHGYHKREEDGETRYGYLSNPNAKWDWYQVGGRWAGILKLKPGVEEFGKGELTLLASPEQREAFEKSNGQASIAYKKDVDIEGLEAPQRESAEKRWDEWNSDIGQKWNALPKDAQGWPKDRDSIPEDVSKWMSDSLGFMYSKIQIDDLNNMTREDYVAKESIWCTYALLWDGKWYQRGDMGWWGISSNEDDNWEFQFKKLWNQIPDDEIVTAVDCHI